MKNTITYNTRGTCSRAIEIVTDGDVIESVQFIGGCSGNTQGVAALAKGMKIDDAIARLKGIKCGFKPTSCPDQLAVALEKMKEQNA
ncbi:MAG: TIGR03905 family TSCPD domain-containing protein [Clostridia bacterium]|nr:TIGR03905 family TSCPD domain-containing protein [Clostridia bacterium]